MEVEKALAVTCSNDVSRFIFVGAGIRRLL